MSLGLGWRKFAIYSKWLKDGLDKPRLITLLGKDGAEWVAYLGWGSKGGRMRLGKGWKEFAKANGLNIGESSRWSRSVKMQLLCSVCPVHSPKVIEGNKEGLFKC
uniref:B3 domain-containing protein REM-like 1 n=1 Tax=Noccaea caerulescens TaxID=107243 RepID=A0A1J3HQ29_NOCCA